MHMKQALFSFLLAATGKARKAISFFLKHQVCVLQLDCVNVFALLLGLDLFCIQCLNVRRGYSREEEAFS